MNDYYNEPEILVSGDINDLEKLAQEQYNKINTKTSFNHKNEEDYHNTYYSRGRYATRTLKMNNKEYLKLNNIK